VLRQAEWQEFSVPTTTVAKVELEVCMRSWFITVGGGRV